MICTLRETLEPALFDLFAQAEALQAGEAIPALQAYWEAVSALRQQCKAHRLHGLNYACMLMESGLLNLQLQDRALHEAEAMALSAWPGLLLGEVISPMDSGEDDLGASAPVTWGLLDQMAGFDWFPSLTEPYRELIHLRLTQDRQRLQQEDEASNDPLVQDTQPMLAQWLDAPTDLPPASLPAQDDGEYDGEYDGGAPPANQVTAEELAMLADALRSWTTPSEDAEGLAAHVEQLENLINAVTLLGMTGLRQVLQALLINAAALQTCEEPPAQAQQALLHAWPQRVTQYLNHPQNHEQAVQLCQWLGDPLWPYPVQAGDAASWPQDLTDVQIMAARVATDRPTQALPEHVDLSVPSDIDRKVLESLLQELPPHAQAFSQRVLGLNEGGSLADLEEARRVAHTLKGAANTVGIKGVANLTHALEDILVSLGRISRMPSPELCDVLQEAADCLEAMSESLLSGQASPPDALGVHQKVLDWANRLDREGAAHPLPAGPHEVLHEGITHDINQASMTPTETVAAPFDPIQPDDDKDPDASESYLRVPVSLIDSLLKLAGESSILTSQIQDRAQRVSDNLHAMRGGTRQFGQLSGELEQLVDVRGLAMLGGPDHDGLDALEMDQYNELHMLSRRIMESSADSRELSRAFEQDMTALRDLLAEKERMQLEIQRAIQRARMVDVASIVPRLQRTVRQAARVLGRQVQLDVQGADTLVDTQLLDRIIDPLMHLLRNAVDHGIEPADLRVAQGKPASGHITVRFASVGNHVIVRCQDDGAGLDLAAIRSRAVHMGLMREQDDWAPQQIMRLILHPGFSTRTHTTQLSGRGIGMDVVHRTVLDLRGAMEMGATAGQGTWFELRLPVRMSTVQVMLSRSDRHMLAISVRDVEQILPARDELETDAHGVEHYILQGERLPVVRLESLLGLPPDALRSEEGLPVAMIIRDEHRQRQAIIVPELQESRTVVVKPFHAMMPQQLGIDGATILGDGAVAPVLDLPDLLRAYVGQDLPVSSGAALEQQAKLPLCLVVDDSVSVRRSMEQLMQDSGYEVVTARDGVDALGAVQQRAPDIVLVDLEMPRMNGLELTCALRNRDATRATPVVMITSRFTDRHRQLANEAGVNAFLTKPYTEDLLLHTMDDLLRDAA